LRPLRPTARSSTEAPGGTPTAGPNGPRRPDPAVAEHGTSVVLSSHLITDIERVCD